MGCRKGARILIKNFLGVILDVLWDIGRGIRILIKKINYITRLEIARRIY
jgi:hypothetical protein